MEVHPEDENFSSKSLPRSPSKNEIADKSSRKTVEKSNETYFDLYNPTGQFANRLSSKHEVGILRLCKP